MNNLKRVLSLALSGIMLVGMMAVGAGAVDYKDFTDKDEITHTEAVSTMNLLGVIAGKDTGAFDPKGTVTRAEMAKMLTVALNGGKDPILGTKSAPTFTDIKGHWAEQYIEYCASLAIIAGQGDGTFAPDQTVTGTQAAKMMLTAMGYEAEVFNLVGADWAINTNREANDAGLYEKLDAMDPNAGMSRDDAAQLIWNGIQANTLGKQPTKSISTGEITWDYTPDGDPILKSKFKVFINYGQLTNVDEGKLSIADDTDYANKETGSLVSFTKVAADYSEYLGQTVKVMYKASDEVVGVAPVDANTVYTVALSSISADKAKVKFDGTSYTLGYTGSDEIRLMTIGHDGTLDASTVKVASLTGIDGDRRNSYSTVTFVDNDNDGELEYAVVLETQVGKVTYSNNDEIIAGGSTYDRDDDVIPETVKKDGYVATYYNRFTANYTVVELEKQSGMANVNNESGAALKARFGDTWYFFGHNGVNTGDLIKAGDEYDFYAYNGVIVNADLSTATATLDNLVMVVRKNSSGLNDEVRVIYADGTISTLSVVENDYSTSDINFSALKVAALYTVTETSKGYSFKKLDTASGVANVDKIGDRDFVNGSPTDVSVSGSKIDKFGSTAIADSAIVFIYAGADNGKDTSLANNGLAKVVTGKQLKTLNATASTNDGNVDTTSIGYFTSKVDGLTRVTAAGVVMHQTSGNWELPSIGAVDTNYGLIVSDAIKLDSTYIQYDLWIGEEMVTVREKNGAIALTDRKQFDVVTYDKIADGVVENVAPLTQAYAVGTSADKTTGTGCLTIGTLNSVTGSKVWLSNDDSLDRTNDTVYMYYDSSTTTAKNIGKSNGELVRSDTAASGVLVPNVKYVGDGSDLKFILIDVKNMVKDKKAQAAAAITSSTYNVGGDTNVVVTFSKANNIVKGETLTMTVTVAAGKTFAGDTLVLTNAVNAADGNANIVVPAVTAGANAARTVEYSIVATGGVISVKTD